MAKRLKKNGLFAKDISALLSAYNNRANPLPTTVQCLDEIVTAYLGDICTAAVKSSQNRQRTKVRLEDFKFALRHDPVKLARAEELIKTSKVIVEAKKQFNDNDNTALKKLEGNLVEEDEEDEDEDDDDDDDDEDDIGEDTQRRRKRNKVIIKETPKIKRPRKQLKT